VYFPRLLSLLILALISLTLKSQVLFNMGEYRNLAYTSAGFNNSFENVTIGIARRDYIKKIKREVIGVLDVSLPLSPNFFTRRSVRKGFQVDLWKKNDYKIPFMFASSSVAREDRYYKYHDATAEFSIAPGIFRKRYTLALDLRCEMIAIRYRHCINDSLSDADPRAQKHWTFPWYAIGKAGIVGGLNLDRFVMYIKMGYERKPINSLNLNIPKYIPADVLNLVPAYLVIGFGYKFGTKPLEQPKPGTLPENAGGK
jgi:hypothetical protein